jgi:transcription initiation factor TFIID subunit TAF12
MIIKIIPETDEERNRFQENFSTNEITHSGIKEYFVFGNKTVANGQSDDFHEWTGSPRYLMGNLRYFFEVVNDERRMKESHQQQPNLQQIQKPVKFPSKDIPQNQEALENELGKLPNGSVL